MKPTDDTQTKVARELEASDELGLPAETDAELPEGSDSELPAVGALSAEEIAAQVPTAEDIGETLPAIQAIVSRQSERLDALKGEMRNLQESLKSIQENDAQLQEAEHEMSETAKKVKEHKSRLASNGESVQLKLKISEIKDQMKDLQDSMTNHLLNLYRLTGTKIVETDAGLREFTVSAKLLAKKGEGKDE